MRSTQREDERPGTAGRRPLDRDPAGLHSANLGSPVFKERWDRGAPLDWTDFVSRCRLLHDPRSD